MIAEVGKWTAVHLAVTLVAAAMPPLAAAQAAQTAPTAAPPAVTAADYARAEQFLAAAVNPLVVGGTVNAAWLPDDRFTYRSTTADGGEFLLVDPATKTRMPRLRPRSPGGRFGHRSGSDGDAKKLPFQTHRALGRRHGGLLRRRAEALLVRRQGRGLRRHAGRATPNAVVSPDGKRAVFIKDWNLWVRDLASKVERPLTTDGATNFGYATDNAGWRQSARPIVLWSPDSKKVATFQQDERTVGEMYLVETKAGHPVLKAWKYPLPGDEAVAMLHRVVDRHRPRRGGALRRCRPTTTARCSATTSRSTT